MPAASNPQGPELFRSEPGATVLTVEARDLEEMLRIAAMIPRQLMQLGAGRFHGSGTEARTKRLLFGEVSWSPGIWAHGTLPDHHIALAFCRGRQGTIRFQNAAFQTGEIAVVDEGEDFDLRVIGPAQMIFFLVAKPLLLRHARALLQGPLENWIADCRLTASPPALLSVCGPTLHTLLGNLCESPDLLWHPRASRAIETIVLDTLMSTVEPPAERVSSVDRRRIARRAEEYLRAQLAEPVSLRDLCEATETSERTLHLAFIESFGMSPKQLLKTLRLNRARQALRHPTPSTTVTDVALDWGFFHFGRFSVAYREMFGETPLQTLRRHGAHLGASARVPSSSGSHGGNAPRASASAPDKIDLNHLSSRSAYSS